MEGHIRGVWEEELFQSRGVDGNTLGSIVLVVDNQSSVYYTSPYSEVTMGLVGSFPPHNNDIQVRGQSWQTLGEGGHILWQVDYMSCVPVLSLWQSVQRHDGHHCRDEHLFHLCQTL